MPATALARQPDARTVPQPTKRQRLSPALTQAIRLLLSGECKTQKAAAERSGLTATYLCEALAKPKIQMFVARETRRYLSNGTIRASARLIELIDAGSEHVCLDAAKHTLAIEGIKPVESGTNISIINNIPPGYVIDMRDPRDERVIEHEPRSPSDAGTLASDIRGLGGDRG